MKRYILTGAPGAGKTSILRSLRQRGWAVVEEAATEVIAREQAAGFDEPWQSSDFVNKIVTLQRERSNSALRLSRRPSLRSPDSRRTAFDRREPDQLTRMTNSATCCT